METNRLLQFKVLVETGNMRKAAELLHISNGGLSKSMQVLEAELRRKLIIPAGRGIAITEAGREIYAKIGPLLQEIDNLTVKEREESSPFNVVRLGTFEVFSTYFLGTLAAQQLKDHHLLVREYIPGRLEAAVAQKEVDFGITYLPIPHTGVDFVEVRKIEMGIFGLRGKFQGVKAEALPFVIPISPVEGSPTGVKGLDGWPDHLFPRLIQYRVELMESALELCRRGLCVGFFPKFVIELHNKSKLESFRLSPVPLPSGFRTVSRPVYLVKRGSQQEDKIMQSIAKAIRATCLN